MKTTPNRIYTVTVVVIAVLVHLYEGLEKSESLSMGWFLWGMIPYAVCGVVFLISRSGVPAAAGVSVALMFDALTYYSVFVEPRNSTAALDLLFVPAWSAGIFCPVVMLLTWFIQRLRAQVSQ